MKNGYPVLKRRGSDIITEKKLRIHVLLDYYINTTALLGLGKMLLIPKALSPLTLCYQQFL